MTTATGIDRAAADADARALASAVGSRFLLEWVRHAEGVMVEADALGDELERTLETDAWACLDAVLADSGSRRVQLIDAEIEVRPDRATGLVAWRVAMTLEVPSAAGGVCRLTRELEGET